MSNHYSIGLLVEQHHADLRQEAAQERLARLARQGGPRRRRWWERLMLSRTPAPAAPRNASNRPPATRRPTATHRPTATVAAGDSPR
jgi:hypothetical protein